MPDLKNRFNLDNDIPQSRLVTIKKINNASVIDSPLIMDDEFSIKASSKYGQLWEATSNNFLNLLSSTFDTPTGQFALQGAQIWQSTEPIDISLKVNLEMDTDPYKDVVYPSLVLQQTCLPKIKEGGLANFTKETLNLKLKTLIPPGPNINTLIDLMKNNKGDSSGLSGKFLAGKDGKNGVYNVTVGFITFYDVIIKSVEPSFSKTYALSLSKMNKLYPCRAELDIEMTTMEIATTDMVETIIQGV